MSHTTIAETAVISERAAASAKSTGRMLVEFITPGWGSSGYYSAEVLEAAAADVVIPKGTHMYADHPTDEEAVTRPGRSIKDLMAVTTEDARLSEAGSLVGEVQVVPAWKDLIEAVKDHIGVSIRGSATDIVEGEAEGRKGGLIEGLVAPVMSVDFVTRAGRGGKVLQVLESAEANTRAIDRGVTEATVNDTREALQQQLRDAHGTGEGVWVYVRDFDDSTVWFEIEGAGDSTGIYSQTYTAADGGAVTLTGDRIEVRQVTTYVAVARPDSTNPTTEDDQEVTMGNIQIEESQHRELTEKAGRVDALESELATEKAARVALEEARDQRDRRDAAAKIVTDRAKEAGVEFTALESRGLLADLPLVEGKLDAVKFQTAVDEAAAEKKAAGGAGTVRGFGGSTDPLSEGDTDDEITDDLVLSEIGSAFGRTATKVQEG